MLVSRLGVADSAARDPSQARHLQNTTGLNIKKIVRTLRPLQQIRLRIAGYEHLAEDPLTPAATSILEALSLAPQ